MSAVAQRAKAEACPLFSCNTHEWWARRNRAFAHPTDCQLVHVRGRGSMSFFQKVRLFFQVLLRSLSRALSHVLSEIGAYEKIDLTKDVYLRVPKAELFLMSVGAGGSDVVQSMSLSVDEAKQIFQSIERACDLREIVEVKVGDLSWTTDARLRSNPDEIIIMFNGPQGRTRAIAKREDVAAAVAEFTRRFGPELAVHRELLRRDRWTPRCVVPVDSRVEERTASASLV